MNYLWLKALHLVAVIAWMAGLLYLPRLFVYHSAAKPGGELAETLKIMERRLLRAIMNPAMVLTFGLGLALLVQNPALLHQPFMHAKLGLVVVLAAFHGYLARCRKAFAKDTYLHTARFYRILNEIPTVLMIVIVLLIIVKPDL